MICTYKNFIIWLSSDGIRAISDDKNVRLKLKFDEDKCICDQTKDMIKWIDNLEKIKKKLIEAKKSKLSV